jgi:predicted RNase H-like nuclease (RuvC/YqgF family)
MDATSVEKIDKALVEVDKIGVNLSATRKEFHEALDKFDSLNPIIDDIKKILKDNKATIEELDRERKKLEVEKQKKEEKISQLSDEQQRILKEYSSIEAQLKKFTSLVKDFEGKEVKFDDLKASLSILSILLEKIFQGQPHARILYVLHGGANEMTRDHIKNATGISGAMVLRAVHELARENLVIYDEDTTKVKLVKRFY